MGEHKANQNHGGAKCYSPQFRSILSQLPLTYKRKENARINTHIKLNKMIDPKFSKNMSHVEDCIIQINTAIYMNLLLFFPNIPLQTNCPFNNHPLVLKDYSIIKSQSESKCRAILSRQTSRYYNLYCKVRM